MKTCDECGGTFHGHWPSCSVTKSRIKDAQMKRSTTEDYPPILSLNPMDSIRSDEYQAKQNADAQLARDIEAARGVKPADSIAATLAERGKRYGVFSDHAFIAQGIKRSMNQHPGWQRLDDDMKQALETIGDKIARILNGDPSYADNWHDIAGYAKLVDDRLQGQQPR